MEVSLSEQSIQGERSYQEDRLAVVADQKHGRLALVVCDGHGGERCSEFVHARFAEVVRTRWPETGESLRALVVSVAREWDEQCLQAMGLQPVVANWPRTAEEREDFFALPRAVQYEEDGFMAGTTFVCVLVDMRTEQVLVANVGDSRALYWSGRDAVPDKIFSTDDHKPLKREMGRIRGEVVDGRYNGDLAVGRAIGDNSDTCMGTVLPTPDIHHFSLTRRADHHFVLASDGVWDVVKNQKAVDIVLGSTPDFPAADRLVQYAYEHDSGDNITAVHLHLRRRPRPAAPRKAKPSTAAPTPAPKARRPRAKKAPKAPRAARAAAPPPRRRKKKGTKSSTGARRRPVA